MLPDHPRTLFVIHRFDAKPIEDSAGVIEVMNPMLASGLLGEHRMISLGRDTADYLALIEVAVGRAARAAAGAPVVIYGAGAHTRQFYPQLGHLRIAAVADRDPSLWGTHCMGHPVIAPDQIPAHAQHVLISSRAYEQGILQDLAASFGDTVRLHPLYGPNPDGELRAAREAEIRATVRAFRPDLLVHTPVHPHENLSAEFFLALRCALPAMRIVTLWWDYDEAARHGSYLDFERETLCWADVVIENSNGTRVERMRRGEPPYERHRNCDKVLFHPTVFDPALFHPEPEAEPRYDIALFGSSVGRRREWIDRLSRRYGERFHHLGGTYETGRAPLPVTDYAAALRLTRICVNTQTYPFRTQCKGKVRETLACGVLLLEEDNPETRLLLQPGEGIEYFSDEETLFALIDRYLADDTRRRETVARGQAIWQTRMSATAWTRTLLERL